MWIIPIAMLSTIHIYSQECFGIKFIDLPGFGSQSETEESEENGVNKGKFAEESSENEFFHRQPSFDSEKKVKIEQKSSAYPPIRTVRVSSTRPGDLRRHWLVSAVPPEETTKAVADKDENLKSKINLLVQQTMHDTEIKVKTVQKLKEHYRDQPSYRVGFIISMIKKSRDVLNELFNVAVKHRDEWEALEQLKIFELIVHTNVDINNLVRQLVEIHTMNLNSSSSRPKDRFIRGGRVALL